jgi:hypothetical protein
VTPGKNATDYMQKQLLEGTGTVVQHHRVWSSEVCLLKLLPIKNPFFRQIEANVSDSQQDYREIIRSIERTSTDIDSKRNQLEPVFNPEDSTLLQITKGERGEQLIESLRNRLVELVVVAKARNKTGTLLAEQSALYALSEVGELLSCRSSCQNGPPPAPSQPRPMPDPLLR